MITVFSPNFISCLSLHIVLVSLHWKLSKTFCWWPKFWDRNKHDFQPLCCAIAFLPWCSIIWFFSFHTQRQNGNRWKWSWNYDQCSRMVINSKFERYQEGWAILLFTESSAIDFFWAGKILSNKEKLDFLLKPFLKTGA